MADAGTTGRNSTLVSALLMVLLVVAIAAIAVFLILNPAILESLVLIALVAVVVIVIVAAMIFLLATILALPYYAAKGETFQTGASYDLDDVKPVREKDSEEKDDST
ncbi:MAG: hypothetical protein FWG60_01545 [Methanomassiliicoccaceae archaeon]|nr:hypothetical protein [Methanomassiliicoccaceae archaeon]